MRNFHTLGILLLVFGSASSFADFSVDEGVLKALIAKDDAEKLEAQREAESQKKAAEYALRLAADPYLEDVVLFDTTYKTVSEKGRGDYFLSGNTESLSLLSAIERILPPGFKLVASGEHILVEPTVSWNAGESLKVALERTGLEHLLEFVIDWDRQVLAIRKATSANHTVLFDGRYSPVSVVGKGSYSVSGSSGSVNLTAALDAIMPEGFKVVSVNPDVLVRSSVSWSHGESLVSVLERAGYDNVLSFDLNWDDSLVVVRGGKAFSPHQVAASTFVSRSFFVPFASGATKSPADTGALLSAAKVILENKGRVGSIKVTGISKSKSSSIDPKLLEGYAKNRSSAVYDKLARLGAPEEIMVSESDFLKGFVKNVSGALIEVFGKSPKTVAYSKTAPNKPLAACGSIDFSRASLRFNIDKAIRDCGFSIGKWQFGDSNTVSDWLVENPYAMSTGRTVDDVLAHIGATYGIGSSKEGSLINFFEASEGE